MGPNACCATASLGKMRKPKLVAGDWKERFCNCYELDQDRTIADGVLLQLSNAINLVAVWIYWNGTLQQERIKATHVLDIQHMYLCQFYCLLTLFSTIFSALYHASIEQKFLIWDVIFAHASIIGNFALAFMVWNRFVAIGAIIAFSSLYFFKNPFNNYVYSHSCWHALVGFANACFSIGFTQGVHQSPYPFSSMTTGHF
jgi:hypothetical protein